MGDNVANEIIGGTNEIIGVVGPIGTIQLSDGQSGLDGSALANVQYGLNYANMYATNFIGNFDGPLILPDPDRGVVFNDGGLSNVAGTFFYNADGSVTINGNLTVTGNTFLDGNVTVIGTENLIIQDPIIEIANTSIDGTSMGLVMQRPSGNVMMAYLSTENSSAYANTLVFSYTDGSAYGTSLVPGLDPLNVLFTGNVQVGLSSNLLIDVTRSNIIVTSSNVSANYYHGNAYHLVSLTGAAGGTYGGPVNASSSNIAVITVDNTGRITGISNLTVSTELSNLEQVVNRGNVTSNTVQFISAPIAFVTQGGVGIANINPQHTLSVGSNLYVNNTGSNVLTVSGNVSSNYYHGNAYHLVSLTDAGSGTYGSGTSVSQVTVDSKGRITNIQDVLITGISTSSNLDIVANNGNVTSNTLQFINAHTAFVTNFTSNIGANIEQLHNVTVTGVLTDQILVYNGNQWENDFPQRTFLMARAKSGETILKGNTVYIIDSYNNNVANVGLANASDPDKMPAVGIAYENFTSSGVHPVVTFGKAEGIITNGFGEGDTVYVSNLIPGGLTNVKPTGGIFTSNPDLIQNIGFVIKSDVNGVIKVTGVGRSNDIPNANVLPNDNSIQYVYVNTAGNDLKKIDPSLLYTATPTLQQVTDTGNTTTNVVQFQNSTTAFVVTENNARIKFNSNIIINSDQNRIAIGRQAGQSAQADYAVAIGPFAAYVSQGLNSVAIGKYAGELYQADKSVAIGIGAGQNYQNTRSVAIGQNAGFYQGQQSIAIGDLAGEMYQNGFAVAVGSPAGRYGQNAYSIAVGFNAGYNVQGESSVAIGDQAGQEGQNNYSVAIGYTAGRYGQNTNSVAIGYAAGQTNQQQRSIAIGTNSGQQNLGFDSICIGSYSNARDRSIVLNASGSTLYGSNTNATYISPIRYTQDFVSNVISYVTAQKEVIDSGRITINGSSGTVSITGNLVVSGNTFININANVIPNDSNVKYVYVGTGGNNIEKIDPSKLITGPLTLSVTGIDMFPENNLSTITTTSNNYGGGVLAPNGKIYYIPLNASNVGVMDPSDNSFTTILSSETALSSSLKYNGGILAPNGKIYCIPFNASNVGVIDPRTDSFTTISGPNLATQKYVGGVLAPNGNVYCIPFNASNVGVINTNNDSFTTILSAETTLSSANKYAGGVLAPTGNVYCVPYNSSNVGIIDPINHTFTTILSSESALSSTDKYAGGVLAPNGKIYCVPFNSSNVGVIDPFNGSLTIISISDAGNEKYYGGALAPNGKIYCVPYNASNVGVVDPITNTFDVITGLTSSLNKYVGGVVAPNGKIYCVPFDQTNTLVIKTGIPSEGSWILQPEFNKL